MIQALSQSDMLCNLSKMCSLHFCQCDMHFTRARLSYLFQQTKYKEHAVDEGIVYTTSRTQALNVKHHDSNF